jgi:hypothetical protein
MANTLDEMVAAVLPQFEEARGKARKRFAILLGIGIPLIALGVVFFYLMMLQDWPTYVVFLCALLIIVGIVFCIVAGMGKTKFSHLVTSWAEESVNQKLFPKAIKDPSRGLLLKKLMEPGFFAEPDRYFGSDYLTASYEGISFEKASYRLQRLETHTDSRGHSYTTYEDYAQGTMYRFQYDRDFGQVVKVLEKQGLLSYAKGNLQKVETEYILFNKKFLTLASDATTVFYLLTPQVQEKIMSLEEKFKGQFFLAFIGNELFIAVNDSNTSVKVAWNKPLSQEEMMGIVELYAIPAVFIKLLGLNKAKFEKNAGVMAGA